MNTPTGVGDMPTTEEYTRALKDMDVANYVTVAAYFSKALDFFLRKMTESTMEIILRNAKSDTSALSASDRLAFQELSEQERARYRKLAASALYHLGIIEMFSENYYGAVARLARAVELDPEKYREDLIEVLTKKILWERAIWKKCIERAAK